MKSVYYNYDEPLKVQMAMDYLKEAGINSTFRSEGTRYSKPVEVLVDDEDYEKASEIINNTESLTAITIRNSEAGMKFQKLYYLVVFLIILITVAILLFSR